MNKPGPTAPSPINAADLRSYIESQDDFAFELDVYQKALERGIQAEHAGLYEDPVTNKPRQFDIRVNKAAESRRISLAIECKGLAPTFPLLVSCVPRSQGESYHEVLYFSETAAANYSHARVRAQTGGRWLYRPGEPVGKQMRQVRRDSKGELTGGDEVFDKWMQALASAGDLVTGGAKEVSRRQGGRARFVAILPILVVSDDTLWVANYQADGRVAGDPSSVDEITFYLGRKYTLSREATSFTISHLHIYTRRHIPTLFDQIAGGGAIWSQVFDLGEN